MLIIPAIDLKDGKAVRLKQGKMNDATYYSTPLEAAQRWVEQGARRLHLVDLNGAFAGQMLHARIVKEITSEYQNLPIEIGGGIRTMQGIEEYLNAGIEYVILGTIAVEDKEFVKQACKEFAGHVICGVDAKDGKVATRGWDKITEVNALDLAQEMADFGVSEIIFTDINRDGLQSGVNLNSTFELAKKLSIPVIASGGVSDMQDIKNLLDLNCKNIGGVITGRAIYEGSLDLKEAQAYIDNFLQK